MKQLFLLLFLILCFTANATTYYFSASGNDANNGTSTSTPWKTLSKFNSVFASKSPGDNFLFNRGDVFYGGITISRSGTAGLPITIGAYGTGAKPIITGFTTVSAWTNLGANIWESTSAVSTLATCNMVTINGVNTAMGRTPNYPNYYVWSSHAGTNGTTGTTLTSTANLTGSPDWTGAELAVFTTTYRVNRHPITAQSGSTISYNSTGNSDFWQGSSPGYFNQYFHIQNDVRTLDVQNEWYYNPSTKKLRMYSTASPTNVQLATVDTLVWTGGGSPFRDYITFDNLSFEGSNINAIELSASKHIKVQYCDFNFIGRTAVYAPSWGSPGYPGLRVSNSTINNANGCGIDVSYWFTNDTIRDNTIKNIGMLVGMGGPVAKNSFAIGISATGANGVIAYNTVDSTGMNGINFHGSNTVVNNNYVNHACIGNGIKDGGGIYTAGDGTTLTNVRILNNIVLNSGTYSKAIDLDDKSNGIEIGGNTSSNACRGIYLHNSWNINIHDNTTFNNSEAELLMAADVVNMTNITVKKNIFVAKTLTQKTIWNNTINTTTMPLPFTSDSNYFARPIDDNLTIQTYIAGGAITQRTLAGWQTLNGQDAHSKKSPKTITDVNDLRFEYNTTSSNKTVNLGANYIDVKNVSYNGTITLAPYTSAVLIRNGAATNQSPAANAGTDQSITLPTSTVNLSGSGTDPDGSISAYNWTKISAPSGGGGTITSASSTTTTVTALVQGVYQLQLKVTDNNGATDLDTVQITVNAAANIAPTANASTDQVITLPTSSVSLSGSGTDTDGTILAYSWTNISGPVAGTITSASSATTTVTALVQGVYQYELKVTDNNGATGRDTMQVTVNAAANIAPTANADTDQSITLPTSAVSLSGSGTDTDGTILAYSWTNISGPVAGTITSASSATTTVTALVQGVYQYELKVTDNNGATGRDTMQVTVNAAANIAPTANADTDQSITLPTSSVSLSGSGTDTDGTILAYSWTNISGPVAGTITSASSATTTVTALVQGVYQYELKVTDNNGATGRDTMQVTVNAAANIAPTANAGTDQSITLPTSAVSLSGGGTDTDGTILAYSWTKISGPASGTIISTSSATTTVTALVQGVYQYELKVTDNNGATDLDTLQVTVNAAANIAPTANAGTDQSITLPTSTATLSGSGTDPNGSISAYNWTKISGPAGTITKATSATTTVTALVQGVYQFQLKVTDNNGATGLDNIQITVKAAGSLLPAVNPANTVNGLDYKYYEGSSYNVMPVFSNLIPVKTGTTTNFNISLANRAEIFSFNFTGFINVPSDGQYTFYTFSDDGTNLYIDNILVVNNDGQHYNREMSGTIGLKAGKHAISVGYFQQLGGKLLTVSYAGPGISKQTVPASALYRISSQGNTISINGPVNETIISSIQVGVKAYPSPFANHIEINITGVAAGEYKLMLVDASGKVLWTKIGIKNAGAFQQSVNTSALKRGIYFLKVIQNNTNSEIKLVK